MARKMAHKYQAVDERGMPLGKRMSLRAARKIAKSNRSPSCIYVHEGEGAGPFATYSTGECYARGKRVRKRRGR